MRKIFVVGNLSKYKNIYDENEFISSDDVIIESYKHEDFVHLMSELIYSDIVFVCTIVYSKDESLIISVAKRLGKEIIYASGNSKIEAVMTVASRFFEIHVNELTGRSRREDIVSARSIVCYAFRQLGFSTIKIGSIINRNYSTVLHECKNVEDIMSYDKKYAEKVNKFIKEITE